MVKRENVQFLSYINCDWDSFPMFKKDHWGDARVQYKPDLKAYWLKQIKSQSILQSSQDLFEKLGN